MRAAAGTTRGVVDVVIDSLDRFGASYRAADDRYPYDLTPDALGSARRQRFVALRRSARVVGTLVR